MSVKSNVATPPTRQASIGLGLSVSGSSASVIVYRSDVNVPEQPLESVIPKIETVPVPTAAASVVTVTVLLASSSLTGFNIPPPVKQRVIKFSESSIPNVKL